jgi:hypothetical protein
VYIYIIKYVFTLIYKKIVKFSHISTLIENATKPAPSSAEGRYFSACLGGEERRRETGTNDRHSSTQKRQRRLAITNIGDNGLKIET